MRELLLTHNHGLFNLGPVHPEALEVVQVGPGVQHLTRFPQRPVQTATLRLVVAQHGQGLRVREQLVRVRKALSLSRTRQAVQVGVSELGVDRFAVVVDHISPRKDHVCH